MKVTIDYEIPKAPTKVIDLRKQIEKLEQSITDAIASGKYKPKGRKVNALKKEIENVQAQLDDTKQKILLKKFNHVVTVPTELLSDTKELEMELSNQVRLLRSAYKTEPDFVTKKVFNQYDVKLIGGVHIKPNVYGEIFEKSIIELIDKPKVPSDPNANYLGIEIECLIKKEALPFLKDLLCKQRLHKNVQAGTDGSIRPDLDGYKGIELRVLVTEKELQSVMTKLSKCLKHRKVDAYVNRSCGLHVHLDMRNRDVNLMYQRLFRVQNLLRLSQPTSRLDSTYCRASSCSTFDSSIESGERYSVINSQSFEKHKTLEIRVHEGTVNTKDITNWCLFLIGVLNSDITSEASTFKQLEDMKLSIPESSMEYISSRIMEYDSEVA